MGLVSVLYSIVPYASTIISCFIIYILGVALHRLYFHPLSKYPGPPLWTISRLPSAYHFVTGRLPYEIAKLHEIYGPVVRIAPDELNYILEEAWQDKTWDRGMLILKILVYGKPSPRNTQLQKDPAQFIESPEGHKGLLLEPNDDVHAHIRRNFSPGFSEKVLREQESILTKYFDLLIQRLRERTVQPVNIDEWYNFITFDIIGDLTFGDSFNCLENSTLHYWLELIHAAGKAIAILGLTQKFYPLDRTILTIFARSAREEENKFRSLAKEKVLKRLESPDSRPDLMWYAQKNLNTEEGMKLDEVCETAVVLIAAGSETTASLLSGVTYHLLTNPSVLARLNKEVRSTFKSEAEITAVSVNGLEYELAVLNEALRIYPPVPGNLTRIVPPEGCMIAGRFVSGNTYVAINQWSAYHSPANFKRPYEFVPERWLGDPEFKDDKRRIVNPFSVGPRNCLGRNLAYVEMRVILARMIFNFDMELCEESKGWLGLNRMYALMNDRPPLMVKLTPVART